DTWVRLASARGRRNRRRPVLRRVRPEPLRDELYGVCVLSGSTCVCDIGGSCGAPTCVNFGACTAPQTSCNPTTCMCEVPGAPSPTPTNTPGTFCGLCAGSCGLFGTCIASGSTCMCSDGTGGCAGPVCLPSFCAPGQTCNPSSCRCEAVASTPTATTTATPTATTTATTTPPPVTSPSVTPSSIKPVPALSFPMPGLSILALALVALLAGRRPFRRNS